jgi:hypothetical protein
LDELSSTFAWGSVSEDFALFRTLSSGQRLKAFGAMVRRDLVRGQMLVAQGEPSDALFVVLHGALAVRRTGDHAANWSARSASSPTCRAPPTSLRSATPASWC